jgi:hypothetical protein
LTAKMEVPASLPMGDLHELYINIVENYTMDSLGSALLEHVRCPIYPPIALSQDRDELNFDFHDGCRFLRNRNLSINQPCSLINLFALLVTFRQAESLPKVAAVLPRMILDFA